MKFLGIDFGWQSGASGLCCLQWEKNQLKLLDLDRKDTIAEILTWVENWAPARESALIAVDAPTIIPNTTGMRLPDKLTHHHFGRYHAGCYPASLSRPYAHRTVELGNRLVAQGFVHAPMIDPQKSGRYQIEVFPHPAIVNLFRLDRILKYKKGKLAERQLELLKLHQFIFNELPQIKPPLNLKTPQVKTLLPFVDSQGFKNYKGAALKALEDQLDSLICAYVGAYWWYWGEAQNLVLGDETTGYIIVPKRQ